MYQLIFGPASKDGLRNLPTKQQPEQDVILQQVAKCHLRAEYALIVICLGLFQNSILCAEKDFIKNRHSDSVLTHLYQFTFATQRRDAELEILNNFILVSVT